MYNYCRINKLKKLGQIIKNYTTTIIIHNRTLMFCFECPYVPVRGLLKHIY